MPGVSEISGSESTLTHLIEEEGGENLRKREAGSEEKLEKKQRGRDDPVDVSGDKQEVRRCVDGGSSARIQQLTEHTKRSEWGAQYPP